MKLIGPFAQLVTMRNVRNAGPVEDVSLEILPHVGILIEDGKIAKIDNYENLRADDQITFDSPVIAIPGLIDAHTHLCWGGSRTRDYALRVRGVSYQEIAKQGGGILDTVAQTREASLEELTNVVDQHLDQQLSWGVATTEVKSGYGLSVESELKMLKAIQIAARKHPVDVISTCLAAHTLPPEFNDRKQYLNHLQSALFPRLKPGTHRIDIFIEEGAFSPEEAFPYLQYAKKLGFEITVHANQFTHAGVNVACQVGAVSADHLEHLTDDEICLLKQSGTIAVALPGASLGLGERMAPVRKMLDAGLSVAIASDWNPGSAPMGNLLAQAALLGAFEKLSLAETLAGITKRAAAALKLPDRGVLEVGKRCDLTVFKASDWREIFYYQGSLQPSDTVIQGKRFHHVDRSR
ncbi:Imidazolonepropionase [Waddlia chondrophila 2032/99]|uniref:Imidazolonepropionase n=1 Tax=Waddlia chondrophila 2032/99 TaxID=765953 RepID=F8LDL9_9BACT|nr:Imidazolonepropionase [Waddlia chondrophila 2032/99]